MEALADTSMVVCGGYAAMALYNGYGSYAEVEWSQCCQRCRDRVCYVGNGHGKTGYSGHRSRAQMTMAALMAKAKAAKVAIKRAR
jgi:hypothetical protein